MEHYVLVFMIITGRPTDNIHNFIEASSYEQCQAGITELERLRKLDVRHGKNVKLNALCVSRKVLKET